MTHPLKAVLFGTALFLASSIANAQVWRVDFIDPPTGLPGDIVATYSDANPPVSNIVTTAEMIAESCKGKKWFSSHFTFSLTNPSLDAPSPRQLVFRNFRIASVASHGGTGTFGSENVCKFPGLASTDPNGYPGCVAEFINPATTGAGYHPQALYREVRIKVNFNDVPFLTMPYNTPSRGTFSSPVVQLAIYEKNDCAPVSYAGVGLASEPAVWDDSNGTTIERLSGKQWRIDVNQRIPLIVFGYASATSISRNGKVSTTCSPYISSSTMWTEPVKFSMLWTMQ